MFDRNTPTICIFDNLIGWMIFFFPPIVIYASKQEEKGDSKVSAEIG